MSGRSTDPSVRYARGGVERREQPPAEVRGQRQQLAPVPMQGGHLAAQGCRQHVRRQQPAAPTIHNSIETTRVKLHPRLFYFGTANDTNLFKGKVIICLYRNPLSNTPLFKN